MKIILLQDVAKIGRRYEVATVPDGYALNKLIPQRQAEAATPANLKRVEAMAAKNAASVADTVDSFKAASAALKGKVLDVAVEINPEGNMFEALKAETIISTVKTAENVELLESWINIHTPIKSAGEHTILMSLGEEQGEFSINVVSK